MAELNTTSRNKKETPRVDLTAMVDLAYLLITFFMLTTSLAKNEAMDVVKPAGKSKPYIAEYKQTRRSIMDNQLNLQVP
jgi:biopolymer transport protein ExbD